MFIRAERDRETLSERISGAGALRWVNGESPVSWLAQVKLDASRRHYPQAFATTHGSERYIYLPQN